MKKLPLLLLALAACGCTLNVYTVAKEKPRECSAPTATAPDNSIINRPLGPYEPIDIPLPDWQEGVRYCNGSLLKCFSLSTNPERMSCSCD